MNRFAKYISHIGLATLALAALMAVRAPSAHAVAQDAAQTTFYDVTANAKVLLGNALTSAQVQVSTWMATNSSVMNVWYTGPSSAAFINIASGGSNSTNCITFFAPYNVPDGTVGTAGCSQTGGAIDMGVSTAATMGQVCDLINQAQAGNIASNYHCKLTGGIRLDPAGVALSTTTETAGINPLNQVGGFNIAFGTNTIISMDITPAINRRVILTQCVVNSANTNIQVFGRRRGYGSGFDQQGNPAYDSAIVWQTSQLTANTVGYVPQQTDVQPWVEFATNLGNNGTTVPTASGGTPTPYRLQSPAGNIAYDGHVVVRTGGFSNAGSVNTSSNSSTNYLSCTWLEK